MIQTRAAFAAICVGGFALFILALARGWMWLVAFAILWDAGSLLLRRRASAEFGATHKLLAGTFYLLVTAMGFLLFFALGQGTLFAATLAVAFVFGMLQLFSLIGR